MTPAMVKAMTSNQAMMPSASWAIPRATNQPQPVRGRVSAGGGQVAHATDVNESRCHGKPALVSALAGRVCVAP